MARTIDETVEALSASCLPCELAAQIEDADLSEPETPARWEGVLTYEGQMTGDGRIIEKDALRWDTLPIPLRWVSEDVGAHAGATVVGRITEIERRDDGAIWAAGDFDLGSEKGREAARQVQEGLTPGVSVDLDDVAFEVRVAADNEVEGLFEDDVDEDGRVKRMAMKPDDEVTITTAGRIRAATLVAIPAFEPARLALVASIALTEDGLAALTAAFNPNQLRVPKGNGELSGRWMDTPFALISQLLDALKVRPAGEGNKKRLVTGLVQDAQAIAEQANEVRHTNSVRHNKLIDESNAKLREAAHNSDEEWISREISSITALNDDFKSVDWGEDPGIVESEDEEVFPPLDTEGDFEAPEVGPTGRMNGGDAAAEWLGMPPGPERDAFLEDAKKRNAEDPEFGEQWTRQMRMFLGEGSSGGEGDTGTSDPDEDLEAIANGEEGEVVIPDEGSNQTAGFDETDLLELPEGTVLVDKFGSRWTKASDGKMWVGDGGDRITSRELEVREPKREDSENEMSSDSETFDSDPGTNWIEETGTGHLPNYIRRIADHLIAQGMMESHAIASAVNTVKRWARGGSVRENGGPNVKPDTVVKAAAALAEWEAKKAQAKASQSLTDEFRDVSTKERKGLAKEGNALPDGSFPIANVQDLKNAIQAIGRAKDPEKAKRHIKKRARELNAEGLIPDTWAVLTAGAFPLQPPAVWFSNPQLQEPTPLRIDENGRIFGHVATWGTCHTGYPNTCVTPPSSASGYTWFRTGAVLTKEGEEVPTGRVTMDTLHAPKHLSAVDALAHYEHTGRAVADVTAGEDAFGIWISGALRPDVTPEQVRTLRASPLSGDWRRSGGNLELVAALAVNVPGFPIPRAGGIAAGGAMQTLVAAGMLAPDVETEDDGTLTESDMAYLKSLARKEREQVTASAASIALEIEAEALAHQIGI